MKQYDFAGRTEVLAAASPRTDAPELPGPVVHWGLLVSWGSGGAELYPAWAAVGHPGRSTRAGWQPADAGVQRGGKLWACCWQATHSSGCC